MLPPPFLCHYTLCPPQYSLLGEILLTLQESATFTSTMKPSTTLQNEPKYFLYGAKAPLYTHYIITCVLFTYFSLIKLSIQGPEPWFISLGIYPVFITVPKHVDIFHKCLMNLY